MALFDLDWFGSGIILILNPELLFQIKWTEQLMLGDIEIVPNFLHLYAQLKQT